MSGTQTTTEPQSEDIRRVAAVIKSDDGAAQVAFGELFVTHQPAFLRFCASLVGPSDGEDLAQTVWNRIWVTLRQKETGDGYGKHLRSVLFQSARRAAIDQWRSPASKVSGTDVPDDFVDPAPETGEVRLMQQEAEQDRSQRLSHCMSELKKDSRSATRSPFSACMADLSPKSVRNSVWSAAGSIASGTTQRNGCRNVSIGGPHEAARPRHPGRLG